LLLARALPSPRRHRRNRHRLRRTASGRSVLYNLRFPGQYYQAETGLNCNYYRDYDSATGRYVESDPIGLHGGVNTYGYVGASPISRKDPSGLWFLYPVNSGPFTQALAYLRQDPGMSQIIQDLENSATEYDVVYANSDAGDYRTAFNRQTNVISWDPTSAICATDGARISPALALGHEMAHADRGFWAGLLQSWDRLIGTYDVPEYDNVEEQRVITGPEAAAARHLGEDVRTTHHGKFYPVPTPVSRAPCGCK
jgi:RHS repeat-associated protein